jgi:predicted nucleotidyltransferase
MSIVAWQFTGEPVAARAIVDLAAEMAMRFDPERIILFGSYAYGQPNRDSDVDILVVMPHRGPGHKTATRIRLSLSVMFPIDMLVLSAAELRRGVREQNWFIIEVLEKGLVLHDRANPAVGTKGRSRLRRRLAAAEVAKAQSI